MTKCMDAVFSPDTLKENLKERIDDLVVAKDKINPAKYKYEYNRMKNMLELNRELLLHFFGEIR